jgi:hypothetical protein
LKQFVQWTGNERCGQFCRCNAGRQNRWGAKTVVADRRRLFKTMLCCLFIWVLQFFHAVNQDTKSSEGTVRDVKFIQKFCRTGNCLCSYIYYTIYTATLPPGYISPDLRNFDQKPDIKTGFICITLRSKRHLPLSGVFYNKIRRVQDNIVTCSRNRCNWYRIMISMCIVQLHATPSNIKKLIVAQKCFYGEFISPTTTKPT